MNKQGKQRINLIIADRRYPFDISIKDEPYYRNAAKRINSAIEFYRENYNKADIQDILSMSFLSMAIKLEELEQNKDYTALIEEIDKIDTTLSDYLKKEGNTQD